MPPKRKRNDRESGANRPAPHRPADTNLAQHDRDFTDGSPSQGRRASGAGRNGRRGNERRESSQTNRAPPSPAVSRAQSSAIQPTTSSVPQTPIEPVTPVSLQARSPITTNFCYTVLTESRMADWQNSGRQDVIEYGIKSRNDEDIEEISTISQEFTRAVLESKLMPVDAGECIKQILGTSDDTAEDEISFDFDARALFLDTISVFADSEETASIPQLREFVASTGLSLNLIRQVLDATTLEQLGLIRSTFVRVGVRYATNQLYRQANYNLLREESEGYSKLAAELYRTPYNREFDFALVNAAWERVKGLIGTFDLDVGRVLDVVIDVFSATMLRNLRFYTRFLRMSSWWPRSQIEQAKQNFTGGLPGWALPENEHMSADELDALLFEQCLARDRTFWQRARQNHLDAFFELGGRELNEEQLQRFTDELSEENNKADITLQWLKATKTLPPPGNRTAAQLLGFKFRFYTSEARDKTETLPANLYYLAAFLIKIGFVSLIDLYPHLWPSDEAMDGVRERRIKELEEKERASRQGAEPNALLSAGALTDDTLPTLPRQRELTAKTDATKADASDAKTDDEAALPEPREAHKADLVTHLLVVGAIPEALFLLGRFPWLPDAYPDEIYPAINRILLHSIDKVARDSQPREARPVPASIVKPDVAVDQSGTAKGSVKLIEGTAAKILRWPHADGVSKGVLYKFYLDEWADNVPICQTVDDFFTLCSTLLNVSGVNIGREATLVKKIAAIGVKSFAQDMSAENMARWQDLLRRILVPALSFTSSNVDVVAAVWDLLKHYPTQVRYNIYAECYEGQISRLPAMAKVFKAARLDTLATLKRLSLQNISSSAKKLAKTALSSPGIVCKVALDQIEAYSNLIEAFVECTKYFTELGYDVLVWSLLSSLGGKQRSRTQESSVLLTSRWLQALSKFSGKVFRRFSNIDPTPVIQYVNDQVGRGNSTDLIILKELISSMGGIVSSIDFTEAQLSALTGGELLRRQTLIHLGDKRFESDKSATRFMGSLKKTRLASQLLVNIAQYRQSAIYKVPESEAHVKYLATVLDDSQQALVQFVELLRHNLTPEEFDALIPSVPQLLTDFGLEPALAFLIGRGSLAYLMTGAGRTIPIADSAAPAVDAEDAVMAIADSASTQPSGDALVTDDAMAIDDKSSAEKSTDLQQSNGRKSDRFIEVLEPTIAAVRELLPQHTLENISPEFFALFWSLQTGDLAVPRSSYNAESVHVARELDDVRRDRSDMSRNGETKREKKTAALQQVQRDLLAEINASKERLGKTRLLLIKQSSMWFPAAIGKSNVVSDTLIEECLVPRLLLSPADAEYCHSMLMFLHANQVPNFKLASLYDRFFSVNRLRAMIFSCSVREAECFGRFIKLTLGNLSGWHSKKALFESEAVKEGRLGFATAFDEEGKPTAQMDHDSFRDLLWTWHRNLAAALRSCLNGSEWMHIRNAITVLKSGLEYFPAVNFMGKQFLQVLGTIAEREAASKNDTEDGSGHRVDLSVTANTALSALKKHSTKWVIVQDFRSNTTGDVPDEKKTGGKSSSLRPSAPEFKPLPDSTRTVDEEDGEVDDNKSSQRPVSQSDDGATRGATPKLAESDTVNKINAVSHRSENSRSLPSRGTTPRPPNGSRQESGRVSSLGPAANAKLHSLPSRPDVPMPGHFTQDLNGQIRTQETRAARDRDSREPVRDPARDHRELRDSREPRGPRVVEDQRAQRRDGQTPDRRAPETTPRDIPRTDRDRSAHRSDGGRRADSGPPERGQGRDRGAPSSGSGRSSETTRGPRDSPSLSKAMPPPHQVPDAQGPSLNPERARMMGVERPEERTELINPARAALIQDVRNPSRQDRDDSRERHHGTSPRRGERAEPRMTEARDERSARSQRQDHRAESVPSSGSRLPRNPDHELDRAGFDRARDPGAFHRPGPSRGEMDHGRLSQQDPDFGRLNGNPSALDTSGVPPEGPRGRGRSNLRAASSTLPGRPDNRMPGHDFPRPPSPDRGFPPTGPASSRSRRNQGPNQYAQQPSSNASPAAPTGPAGGIHPERLRHLNNATGSPGPPIQQPYAAAPSANTVPVHPDRMGHIHKQNAPPSGPAPRGRPSLPPMQTPDRPPVGSGHRPLPIDMDSSPMSAPTGPASNEGRGRTGGRRQLDHIQSTLASGGSRGRNSRTMAGSDAQVLTGASPVSTPVHERMDPLQPSERGTNGADRPDRHDHERSRHEQDGPDRAIRSGQHGGRERSPGRDRGSKDVRDSKSGVPPNLHSGRERERDSSSRRSGRESGAPGRDSPAGFRSGEVPSGGRERNRDSRHRQDGNGGGGSSRHDEQGRGSGTGRGNSNSAGVSGGPRGPGDERRESRRGGEERSSRKRQSEEGFGGPGGVPSEKRQRR
ncbi:transcription factor/nuclear export subunit protein 2-domain-containing protein [Microdochium trichocladiopsis]|uniref:THO complex subunit 2 n=1 Tax=Microdochium trichocladiopsis TaxID=1682393 RepID=A0A9P8Y8D4_9PEZI|nr:transcription factor/nuclear export subunit protein 2-domain-containing protein [Microdochium trichocladiopsis]KAH7030861.1 transcription factor/nuclear export subunit protein 2-domain-containing protein [Microdochium trichocladiopsis]